MTSLLYFLLLFLNRKKLQKAWYKIGYDFNFLNSRDDHLLIFSVRFGANNNNKTGNKTRLVNVATNNVTDVNHPRAMVPPKLLPQKIMKPAVNTNAV